MQATDFWAFFQNPPRGFEASRDLVQSPFNLGVGGFVMQPEGDQTPFARNHRLTLNAELFRRHWQ